MTNMSAALPLPEELGRQIRPLTRREYDRLVEQGAFAGEPLELLEGFVVTMTPEGAPHVYVIDRLNELLVPPLAGRRHHDRRRRDPSVGRACTDRDCVARVCWCT